MTHPCDRAVSDCRVTWRPDGPHVSAKPRDKIGGVDENDETSELIKLGPGEPVYSSAQADLSTARFRSGRELGSSVTRRPSAPHKGFIGLVVSARSDKKRLSGHLDRSRPMLL
ncbi:hypothetical protein Taro_045826 [Colocasia esculenta]|uniref:Uncharacterized protein n=1 Tax=Colocasia esculenta TaxID=4460 RepID=A0A843WXY4_COLES|nr:hypothetical protein [Colocasia esculenta]